ncbi:MULTISPECIES: phage tail tape measure protein [unclassified Streptomyces]|uniref:phage tail tape measure protein n=1 Tax=unclassified Streptomyces TaxID=2593676 RepID=UPI002E2E5F08|nr:phage tail tape measure protein [Streptomyces sp. NBC_00228]
MSFAIADAVVNIRAQADEGSVNESTGSMGRTLTKWAAGIGLGALISKGIADNLNMQEANAKLTAQMGLTKGVASSMGKLSGEVYRDNFGESVGDVNEAIKGVGQNMVDLGTTSKGEIKGMTEAALGLKSTFDVDVNESTKAAGQLMKNGLAKDGKEAFDLITKGMQMGLNTSDDFLETITEYSPQFTKLGIDGPTALGLLSQGLKAGAKDTDVIADAFKEFSLRAIDGSKSTVDAYQSLGLNANKTAEAIAKGGPTAQKATGEVIQALKGIKDPQEQNRIGVELFGTQWEDTLRQILPKLDVNKAKLTDVDGATKKMNDTISDTPQAKIEGLKRQAEGLLQSAVQLPGPFGELSAAVVGFGPGLLSMGGSLALIGPALIPAITATWAWTTALLANPVTWIVIGIVALIAAIVLIATKTDWFQKLWAVCWNGIKSLWDTVWGGLKTGFNAFVGFFTNTIPNAVGQVVNWVKAHWPLLITIFGGPIGAIVALVVKNWDKIKNFISDTISSVVNKVKSGFNSARDFVSSIGSGIVSRVTSAFNSVVSAVRNKISSAVSSVKGFKTSVLNFFSGAGSWLVNSGQKLIQGFVNGIKNMAGAVKNAVSGVLSKARNLLPFSPAKEGPFSGKGWTEYSGASLMQGLASGINSTAAQPIGAMNSALSGVAVAAAPGIPTQASTAGNTYHIAVHLDAAMDLTKPGQARATAKLLSKEMALALRDQEKERR